MATNRPIVSTPIRDVERFYSDIVYLADTPEGFAHQLDAALNETAEVRGAKRRREERILSEHAWESIADNMHAHLLKQWAKTPAERSQRSEEATRFPTASSSASSSSARAYAGGE